MLAKDDHVTWSSSDNIPDEYANQVANLVAAARVNESGVSSERYQRIMLDASGAIPSIISIKSGVHYSRHEVTDF